MGADPTTIRSIAVSAEDVVDAFVYARENPGAAVLRVTPPFHGRMRARLHVYRVDDAPVTGAIHVAPADLLEPAVVDAFPTTAAYEDRLDETRDPAAIREARGEDLTTWRADALDAIVDTVAIQSVPHGEVIQEVSVTRLGSAGDRSESGVPAGSSSHGGGSADDESTSN